MSPRLDILGIIIVNICCCLRPWQPPARSLLLCSSLFPLLLLFFIYTLIKIFGCMRLIYVCAHICIYINISMYIYFNATICLNNLVRISMVEQKLLGKNETNKNNNSWIRGWFKFIFNKKNQYFQVAFNGFCLWHLCDFDIILVVHVYKSCVGPLLTFCVCTYFNLVPQIIQYNY